jgi:DNA-binding MarR family transcriptional regulator
VKLNNSYVRFLNVLDTLDRMNPGRSLDQIEIALLGHILRFTDRGEELLVGDLLCLKELGSQATLHGRVKNLVVLGYIKLITNKGDGRKKFVIPTKLASKYVEFMSECLGRAVAS